MDQARELVEAFLVFTALPFGLRLLQGVAVFFIAWRVAVLARHSMRAATARTSSDPNFEVLLSRLAYLAVLAFGFVWALDVAGISPAAFVAALGVAGLAITLSLQDVLKNFFAGVYLLFERPFRIGDDIQVKDVHGRVTDVGLRTTSIRAEDGRLILIPNSIVLSEIVTNRSA